MVVNYTNTNTNSLLFHQTCTLILGGQSSTDLLSNPTIFYTTNPYFGAKLSICVAVLTKYTTVYGCILYRYKKKIMSPSQRYNNSRRAIKDIFLVQPHHILPSQPILWSKAEFSCGYFDQKHSYT